MNSRLRWRIVITLVVTLGVSFFAWYPWLAERYGLAIPRVIQDKRVFLGLDLKGGVHMVLRVNTDDAVVAETRNIAARLDEALAGVTHGPVDVLGPGRFRVGGVPGSADAAFVKVADRVAADFGRESGADGAYTFTIRPDILAALRSNTVTQARHTVDRRVNELGVTEPNIAVQGANADEIVVQLPGVADLERARGILGATALLEWKLVERGPASTREALLAANGGVVPAGSGVVADADETAPGEVTAYYLVREVAAITGRDLRNARPIADEHQRPAVAFSLTRDAAQRFAQLTGEHVGRSLAIILDGRVQSAPQIQGRIDGGKARSRAASRRRKPRISRWCSAPARCPPR